MPDEALLVTRDIIRHMLLKRPDVKADIVQRGGRVGVMAVTEMTTDLPEQRDWKKPTLDDRRLTDGERARYNEPGGIGSMTDQEYWNRRARGMDHRIPADVYHGKKLRPAPPRYSRSLRREPNASPRLSAPVGRAIPR